MGTSGSIDAAKLVAELETALGTASTPIEVADATVAVLERHGFRCPSLYLEIGGRLRCQAQRGYWQVLDGIPSDVGMIGRCVDTGRTVEVGDAAMEDEFLYAAPDLCCLIAVPIRHASRVVGVLAVESPTAFPAGAREALETVVGRVESRLARLGGPPDESLAQRVARVATVLTALVDEVEIRREAIDAAVQITGMETAAIVERAIAGHRAQVVAAEGPLSAALSAVDEHDLGQLDEWVQAGSSLYADGTERSGLATHGRLGRAGVGSLAVVPLRASGEHLGSLMVASPTPRSFGSRIMPVLEILGAQTAASIRAARMVAQLERRARQDPLTELGHHATFQEELRARLSRPASGRPVAVLIVDVDGFKAINDRHGHQEGDRVLRALATTLGSALRTEDRLYRIGGDEFATIVEVASTREAEDIAGRMVLAAQGGPVTVSIGIAMAAPGEAADELVRRADAAMYGAKRAGRDTVEVGRPLGGPAPAEPAARAEPAEQDRGEDGERSAASR